MGIESNRVSIRAMEEADIERILANFTEQGWTKPRAVLERYWMRQSKGICRMIVAEYKQDVAGYTVLYPDTAVGPFAGQKIPIINDFNVFQKYQRQGVGNRILDVAEELAAARCDRVQLAVGLHSGYGTAQRMYIKRGYIPDGSGAWYRDAPLPQYADCNNDDDLVLYLVKEFPAG